MKRIYKVNDEVIFHDPGPEMIPVFAAMDTNYRIQSIRPGPGFIPKFQSLREKMIRSNRTLFDLSAAELTNLLNQHWRESSDDHENSQLDVLFVLALSTLGQCRLCGWECKVNRYTGPEGKCNLDNRARHSRPFIHIAEETVINPALVTNFYGCALRCCYCLDANHLKSTTLPFFDPKTFWQEARGLLKQDVPLNSVEFTNPTESLPGVIDILANAPAEFNLPVVLNCHLYGTKLFYELADWITDVWLPDLRYGNDKCAKALSSVNHYMEQAKIGLDAMRDQKSKVIVRILVLPGHVSCCHEPAIELLSEYKEDIWVSVLNQYVPEHEAHHDRNLRRRPTEMEISQVEALVKRYGLRNIGSGFEGFWRS